VESNPFVIECFAGVGDTVECLKETEAITWGVRWMLAIGEVYEDFAQAVGGGISVLDVTFPKTGFGMLDSSDE
jgi:hypothetical protein